MTLSAGTRPTGRRVRLASRAADLLVVTSAVGLGLAGLIRFSGSHRQRHLIGVQGIARFLLLPAGPAAVLAGVRRRRVETAVLSALAAYQLLLTRAGRGRSRPVDPAGAAVVRLLTANLLLDNPRVAEAAGRLADTDVLCLQELTPEHLRDLDRAGLRDALPHAVLDARPGFHGSGLLSRWPMEDTAVLDLDGRPMTAATIRTPSGPLRVVSVHAVNPGAPGELGRWLRQYTLLGEYAAASQVPVVLAGDFNGTADHRAFRTLLAGGLRDAYDVAGRGSGASWPIWRRPMIPLMRLDHALVSRGLGVVGARTGPTPGSDHAHLAVELVVPPW